MKIPEPEDEEPAINLTPVIDIVFNLLIFFLLASTSMKPEKEISIDLPEASSAIAQAAPETEEVTINVHRDGRITLGGADVDPSRLVEAIRNAAARSREKRATIRGDRLVHHEEIVRVMDACGRAGLSNLSVGTLQGD